jgi:hypothetical protein
VGDSTVDSTGIESHLAFPYFGDYLRVALVVQNRKRFHQRRPG